MSHANHPLAKIMLAMIREDATIDEQEEAAKKLGEAPEGKSPADKGKGGDDDEEEEEEEEEEGDPEAAKEDME